MKKVMAAMALAAGLFAMASDASACCRGYYGCGYYYPACYYPAYGGCCGYGYYGGYGGYLYPYAAVPYARVVAPTGALNATVYSQPRYNSGRLSYPEIGQFNAPRGPVSPYATYPTAAYRNAPRVSDSAPAVTQTSQPTVVPASESRPAPANPYTNVSRASYFYGR